MHKVYIVGIKLKSIWLTFAFDGKQLTNLQIVQICLNFFKIFKYIGYYSIWIIM